MTFFLSPSSGGYPSFTDTRRGAWGALESYGGSEDGSGQLDLISAMLGLSFNRRFNGVFLLPLAKLAVRFSNIDGTVEQLRAASAHDMVDRLRLIQAPTLVITGTDDRLIDPASSEKIAKLVPNARLVKVPRGGHAFFIEMHDDFDMEVLRFLRDEP